MRENMTRGSSFAAFQKTTKEELLEMLNEIQKCKCENPGGIYGRLKIDQLGKMQPDTRNPVLVTAMEVLDLAENRYSGIPTIRRTLKEAGLREPVFADERGTFSVTMYNEMILPEKQTEANLTNKEKELLAFLNTPKSRQEIAEYLGIDTIPYAMQTYVNPLLEKGLVVMTIPDKPKSHGQRFVANVKS